MPRYHTSIWCYNSEDEEWYHMDGEFHTRFVAKYLGAIYNYLIGIKQIPVELVRIGGDYHIVSKDAD